MRATLAILLGLSTLAGPAAAAPKLNPGYHHVPVIFDPTFSEAPAARKRTIPYWTHAFSVAGTSYRAVLVGKPPSAETTTIPIMLVPVVITAAGAKPFVLDARTIMDQVVASPLFAPADYAAGRMQFTDAMLHTEFPGASAQWHTIYAPTVAAPLFVTFPAKSYNARVSATGARLVVLRRDAVLDGAITADLNSGKYDPAGVVMYITFNALEADAFGYHFATAVGARAVQVAGFSSWLVGVDDLFGIPSPDAATLSHELAEIEHDPLNRPKSLTRKWGDPFGGNKCFQSLIEVGDAIENAPADVQLAPVAMPGGGATYTVQKEALLQWFTRTSPSDALGGAYSFPGPAALTAPAPLNCL